jgi:hypothetical protein
MQQITYNMLFRWFVGLAMDVPILAITVFIQESEYSRPPSKRATVDLPATGDNPGSDAVDATSAGIGAPAFRWEI